MKVYWTAINTFFAERTNHHSLQFINYYEPLKTSELLKNLPSEGLEPHQNFKYCPAMQKRIDNSFELRFPFDYEVKFDGQNVYSEMYDQKFFNDVINVRSHNNRLISLNVMYIFVPEKSLEMQTTNSYLSDNSFVNRTIAMPGQFNIYDWIRNIEFAFFVKNGYDTVPMKKGDPYLNVKFLTDEPVELKKFYPSDQFVSLLQRNWNARSYKVPNIKPLKYYYDLFNRSKIRKVFMDEINKNLLE